MIKTEFDFMLHKSLWKQPQDANTVFHAKALTEKAYHVTFKEDDKELCAGYWKQEVERHVNNGGWIVLEDGYNPKIERVSQMNYSEKEVIEALKVIKDICRHEGCNTCPLSRGDVCVIQNVSPSSWEIADVDKKFNAFK